jgi:hypothetical protein
VTRWAEAEHCFREEASDLGSVRLRQEDAGGQGDAGEDVEDDGQLEGEETEETGDLGTRARKAATEASPGNPARVSAWMT